MTAEDFAEQLPAIGVVCRKPEKLSHIDQPAEETMMQITWAGIDRAMYLVQNASHEDLGNFVQNPEKEGYDMSRQQPLVGSQDGLRRDSFC